MRNMNKYGHTKRKGSCVTYSNNKTKLYIDDIRIPDERDNFTLLKSYSEAVHWMRTNGCPDYISFDHDLGQTRGRNPVIEKTGFDIAKWMVEYDMNSKGKFITDNFSFTVHSANIMGAANIVGLLECYLRERRKRNPPTSK